MAEVALFTIVLVMAAVGTAVGPTGGIVLSALAVVVPAPAVVPLHASLLAGGSLIRLSVLRHLIDYRLLAHFVAGGLIGFIPAAVLASRIEPNPHWIRLGLGLATLVPPLMSKRKHVAGQAVSRSIVAHGVWTSFITVFVGATGSVVGSLLGRHQGDQRERVATHTGCSAFHHTAKIAIFIGLGFPFRQHLPLIAVLLVASAVGTWIGKYLLVNTPNESLKASFEIMVLGLGGFLCTTSCMALLLPAS